MGEALELLIGGKEPVVIVLELIEILKCVVLDRFKVNEKSGEATIPVVSLAPVLSIIRLRDLLVEGIEGDDIAEEILEPSRENIPEGIKLLLLDEIPLVHFEARHEAATRGRCQGVADPVGSVQNVVHATPIIGVSVVFPALALGHVLFDGLLEELGAHGGTRDGLC